MRGAAELPEANRELVRASRYSGYRRLLDRMATGLLTTEQAMDTDPGAALATVRQWQLHQAEQQRTGKRLAITPDLSRGMGARLDALERTKKRARLLEMALGVFDAAGVVRLQMHREADVSSVSDLLVYSLEELEAVAEQKGGIRQLLEEKWTKVYKVSTPRGLFTGSELRDAA
jgi:hypothetical protein